MGRPFRLTSYRWEDERARSRHSCSFHDQGATLSLQQLGNLVGNTRPQLEVHMRTLVATALVPFLLAAAPTGYHVSGEIKIGGEGGWDYLDRR